MTVAPAVPFDIAPTAPDSSSGVGVWEFAATGGFESVVSGTSKDPNAKVVVLLVSPQTGVPVLAVKAPTTAAAECAVEAEARALADLAERDLGALNETIPRVVGILDFERRRAPAMTALPGRPLSTAYARRRHTRSRRRVSADFAAVDSWLGEFQRATAAERAAVEMDVGVLARLHDRFESEPALDADLQHLAVIHARLRLDEVPRTAVHGDFWFGNVLVSDGRVTGVVDWEAATSSGEPVRDLVRFSNMYALYLDGRTRNGRGVAGHRGLRSGQWGAGLEYAIRGKGWFPELYRQFLERGLARLGARPHRWRDAALAGIAEVAALTDHDDFAWLHLELFRRLISQRHTA
jgi:aminoglycoside phosphotransferase